MQSLSFKNIGTIIMNRLKNIHHSTLQARPHMLLYGSNPFNENIKYDKSEIIKKAYSSSYKISNQSLAKLNKKRKQHDYSVQDLVFTRSRTSVKKEPIWNGSSDVLEVRRNRLLIKQDQFVRGVNIKHTRPYIVGERRGVESHKAINKQESK